MDFFHKNQKLILGVVLVGSGIYFYLTYFKPEATVVSQDVAAAEVGNEVLSLYNKLNSVTLDQSIFSYSLYKRLIDFSRPIPQQVPGRSNPFAPIGLD
jgi:hypothetical protein